MYGLLSEAYNQYRIKNGQSPVSIKIKSSKGNIEGYDNQKDVSVNYFLVVLYIISLIFTVFMTICLFDSFLVKEWTLSTLSILLFLFFVPVIGDVVSLGVFIYWLAKVSEHSKLL